MMQLLLLLAPAALVTCSVATATRLFTARDGEMAPVT